MIRTSRYFVLFKCIAFGCHYCTLLLMKSLNPKSAVLFSERTLSNLDDINDPAYTEAASGYEPYDTCADLACYKSVDS